MTPSEKADYPAVDIHDPAYWRGLYNRELRRGGRLLMWLTFLPPIFFLGGYVLGGVVW